MPMIFSFTSRFIFSLISPRLHYCFRCHGCQAAAIILPHFSFHCRRFTPPPFFRRYAIFAASADAVSLFSLAAAVADMFHSLLPINFSTLSLPLSRFVPAACCRHISPRRFFISPPAPHFACRHYRHCRIRFSPSISPLAHAATLSFSGSTFRHIRRFAAAATPPHHCRLFDDCLSLLLTPTFFICRFSPMTLFTPLLLLRHCWLPC